jgi:hypothetical protein
MIEALAATSRSPGTAPRPLPAKSARLASGAMSST